MALLSPPFPVAVAVGAAESERREEVVVQGGQSLGREMAVSRGDARLAHLVHAVGSAVWCGAEGPGTGT